MTHQYHGFNLLHRIEGNTNNDEECRTAKVDAGDSRQPHDDVWHHRNEGEEYGPCQGDPVHDLIKVSNGRLARTKARDEPAILLDVVAHLRDVEAYCRIEVSKEQDEQHVQCCLQRSAPLEIAGYLLHPGNLDELGNRYRKHQYGRGEDDRHDTGLVDLKRNIGRMATVHLAPNNALGVLDGNLAVSDGDRYDKHHHEYGQDGENQEIEDVDGSGL